MTNRAERIREKLLDIENWNPFCHGTSSIFEPSIKEQGLKPRQCTEDGICRLSVYEGNLESHPDLVYLGRGDKALGTCIVSGSRAAHKFGGEPVVFVFELKKDDDDSLTMDEDWKDMREGTRRCYAVFDLSPRKWLREDLKMMGAAENLPKDITMEIYDEAVKKPWSDEEAKYVCNDLPEHVDSMISGWTVAHRGTIPKTRIKKTFTNKEWYAYGGPPMRFLGYAPGEREGDDY